MQSGQSECQYRVVQCQREWGSISGDDSRPAWLIGYRVSVWGGGYIVACLMADGY